jgi:hypothetical protein
MRIFKKKLKYQQYVILRLAVRIQNYLIKKIMKIHNKSWILTQALHKATPGRLLRKASLRTTLQLPLNMLKIKHLVGIIALLSTFGINAMQPQMYCAKPFNFGTRFERKGLFTIDGWAAHGNTNKGKDGETLTTNILKIHGKHKMHQVGKGVNHSGLSANNKALLCTLWKHTPTTNNANYGVFEFESKIHYTGGAVSIGLNITDELFVGADIPFYKLEMEDPTFVDKTADADKDAEWNQFIAAFDTILSEVNLSRQGIKQTGVGDVSVFAGWTRSTEDIDNLDFLDATLKVGALLGNAQGKDENFAFSIAPGYDKHKAAFLNFDMSFGFAKYASIGFHLSEIFLFKTDKTMRIQTGIGQNGFIKLDLVNVNRDMGNLYQVGGFFKLEYGRGSLFTGYTYNHKGSDLLTAKDSTTYPSLNINGDGMLQGWSSHVVHVGALFDLADNEGKKIHPRFSIQYNHVVRAKRAFLNHTLGGSFGFSITWDV